MKIAFSTNNQKTISGHLGRAKYYLVAEIEDGKLISKEIIEKPKHDHNHSHENKPVGMSMPEDFKQNSEMRNYSHDEMVTIIKDCKYVITQSMGQGARGSFVNAAIRPIITDISDIDEAIQDFIKGNLNDLSDFNQ